MCQPACVLCYFFRHHTQRYPAHSTLDGVARVSLEPLLIVKALLGCGSHWLDFGSPVNQVHSDAAIHVRLVVFCPLPRSCLRVPVWKHHLGGSGAVILGEDKK